MGKCDMTTGHGYLCPRAATYVLTGNVKTCGQHLAKAVQKKAREQAQDDGRARVSVWLLADDTA